VRSIRPALWEPISHTSSVTYLSVLLSCRTSSGFRRCRLVVLTQTNPDFRQVLLDAPEETRVLDLDCLAEPHKGYKTSLNRALMILQNLPVPFERGMEGLLSYFPITGYSARPGMLLDLCLFTFRSGLDEMKLLLVCNPGGHFSMMGLKTFGLPTQRVGYLPQRTLNHCLERKWSIG